MITTAERHRIAHDRVMLNLNQHNSVVLQKWAEELPACYLKELDYVEIKEQYSGLNKSVSSSDIYEMITERMIGLIKEANATDYKKTWEAKQYGKGYTTPFNFVSKKRYRGVNVFLLTNLEPIKNPYFLTFKQITALKGTIKKGSSGFPIVYYTKLFKIQDKTKKIDFGTYEKKKAVDFAAENGINEREIGEVPILKYYNVFNGDDIDGIDFDLENFKFGFIDNELPASEDNRLVIPEAIIKNYPSPAPILKFGGNKASHQGGGVGLIQMPYLSDFTTVQDYYRTLLHEYSHSTGSPERLNRKLGNKYGTKDYAFEELIAEFGATFLSAEAGIIWHTNKNHAAYLKGWNAVLTHLENDNKFIFRAASAAQKVSDFILQFDENGNPLYFKDIKIPFQTKAKIVKKPVVKKEVKEKKIASNYGKKTTRIRKVVVLVKEKEPNKLGTQLGLFGISKNSLADRLANKKNEVREYYKIDDKEIANFLGKIEKKNKESVAITIAGGQGSMKTRFCFQLANAFAQNYKVGHASIEEHPESALYEDKVKQYLNTKATNNVYAPEISNISDVHKLVQKNDVIIIDSFSKLQDLQKGTELDKDFRKKYDGKLFIIIYQLTTDGKMRGGSKSQFDGDIICFIEKKENYKENYVYQDKNRYSATNLEDLKYNIFSKKMVAKATEKKSTGTKLNFKITEK